MPSRRIVPRSLEPELRADAVAGVETGAGGVA